MSAIGPAAILIVIGALFFLVLFLYFIPLGLWITALSSGVHVRIFSDLVGMRLRKVPPDVIVRSKITALKAGIQLISEARSALSGGRKCTARG